MYVPKHYEELDIGVLHDLIRSHPLGAWVTTVDDALVVNHIPFLVDSTQGKHGMLVGHVARNNPIWSSFSRKIQSVVVFQGPQSYITPSWYPTRHEDRKVVPTWNYAVVQVHGMPGVVEDKGWLLKHVTQLSEHHESKMSVPWSVADAPHDYIDTMLEGIVGVEISISTIVGKWKTSQNRPLPDKLGTIAGLYERGDENSRRMAALIQRHVGNGDLAADYADYTD